MIRLVRLIVEVAEHLRLGREARHHAISHPPDPRKAPQRVTPVDAILQPLETPAFFVEHYNVDVYPAVARI